ncbi:MAG: histidine kinase [Enterovirga sp.]|nr:histidine kinase [Enterovirga sp.]
MPPVPELSVSDLAADVGFVTRIAAVPTILSIIARTTGMGFAAVARVTEDRWIACGVRDEIGFGLVPGGELKVETTICSEIRDSRTRVVIEDTALDEIYCSHPTPALYGFRSYVSVPITLPDGSFFGTLCAIDPKPRMLKDPDIVGTFELFADLIAFHIDAQQRLETSAAVLNDERHTAELREQFIAVLGHDLRNPLAAIDAGTQILAKEARTERSRTVAPRVRRSVERMARLIDDVLDFARGRLGGGIPVELMGEVEFGPILGQVVDELRASHPDRLIEKDAGGVGRLRCDPGRIGQLLSNLVANALTHGSKDAPVRVLAAVAGESFELSVSNLGPPIPPDMVEHLFKPFVRATARPSQQGLGLGLYIASEIARAHGGRLDVVSTAQETRFTFRAPLA